MKHVSLCLKELLTHLNELNLFGFQWRVFAITRWQKWCVKRPCSFRPPAEFGSFFKHQIWSSFSDFDEEEKDCVWQFFPWRDVTEESMEHNVSSSLLVPVKVGGLMIHSLQHEHMKCLFSTHIQTEIGPQPPWGLTSLPLLQTVCLCVSLNNLTMTIPPLLLCLITPCAPFSVLSRRRIRDRTDLGSTLGGWRWEGIRMEWGLQVRNGKSDKEREEAENRVEGGGRRYWRGSDGWRISGSTMSSELLLLPPLTAACGEVAPLNELWKRKGCAYIRALTRTCHL